MLRSLGALAILLTASLAGCTAGDGGYPSENTADGELVLLDVDCLQGAEDCAKLIITELPDSPVGWHSMPGRDQLGYTFVAETQGTLSFSRRLTFRNVYRDNIFDVHVYGREALRLRASLHRRLLPDDQGASLNETWTYVAPLISGDTEIYQPGEYMIVITNDDNVETADNVNNRIEAVFTSGRHGPVRPTTTADVIFHSELVNRDPLPAGIRFNLSGITAYSDENGDVTFEGVPQGYAQLTCGDPEIHEELDFSAVIRTQAEARNENLQFSQDRVELCQSVTTEENIPRGE